MSNQTLSTVTLGGGCFWCVEAVFDGLRGVEKVESGYMGGHVPNPTYEQVCGKQTGHVEVVQVHFDASVVSAQEIFEVFFVTHDPTTMDRQGNDVGPQYRSAIFYHDAQQKADAEAVMARISAENIYPNPIVTKLYPVDTFYVAEAYHQDYFANNKWQPYCMFVVAPKVQKFRKLFVDKLKQPA